MNGPHSISELIRRNRDLIALAAVERRAARMVVQRARAERTDRLLHVHSQPAWRMALAEWAAIETFGQALPAHAWAGRTPIQFGKGQGEWPN